MPKSHARYAPEYRRRMMELAPAGRSHEDLAKEFEPTAQSIRNWVAQAARDEVGSQKFWRRLREPLVGDRRHEKPAPSTTKRRTPTPLICTGSGAATYFGAATHL